MADNAGNSADKASWLRLAASWLGMIKHESRRLFAGERENAGDEGTTSQAWPDPSEEDSKASH